MKLRILGALLLTLGLVGCGGDPAEPPMSDPQATAQGSPVDPADPALDSDGDIESAGEPDGRNSSAETDDGAADDAAADGAQFTDAAENPAAGADPADAEEISVRIYFPSSRGDGLIAETRKILPSDNAEDRIKQILGHLLDGPAGSRVTAAVPKGTTLRQAYLASNGTAYVDLSSQLQRGLNGGSMQETLTVYAIVNSVTLNLREVRSVGILVNGQPVDTLNGHLDLRYPLRSNRDLLLR